MTSFTVSYIESSVSNQMTSEVASVEMVNGRSLTAGCRSSLSLFFAEEMTSVSVLSRHSLRAVGCSVHQSGFAAFIHVQDLLKRSPSSSLGEVPAVSPSTIPLDVIESGVKSNGIIRRRAAGASVATAARTGLKVDLSPRTLPVARYPGK